MLTPKVLVAVIHNHDQERAAHLLLKLPELTRALEALNFQVNVEWFTRQPIQTAAKLSLRLRRNVALAFVQKSWYRRLNHRDGSWGANCKATWAIWKSSDREVFVEQAVTDKHVQAWRTAIDGGFEYVMILEDDARFLRDSVQLIVQFIDWIRVQDGDVYIDLAGGLELEHIKGSAQVKQRIFGFSMFDRPLTNTACAYVLSRGLVGNLSSLIRRDPYLKLLPIDWCLNAAFLHIANSIGFWHATPPVLGHGSFTGASKSWREVES